MQHAPDTTDDSPPELKLAALRATAEVELLGAVLAKPAELVAVAEREGIAQWDFGQDDLRLIWLAAKIAGEAGGSVDSVLRLARRALQAEGLWDDTQIGGNWRASMLWSDVSLARLADSAYPNSSLVSIRARTLLHIIRAQEIAADLLAQADAVIAHAISKPSTSTPLPSGSRLRISNVIRRSA